jgi:c-di-GMP-binding flagellar brake protein YcgR
MEIARMTNVNISGGGISFVSPHRFNAGDRLQLKIILPPFVPIHTIANIIRTAPDPHGQGVVLATEFLDLGEDEQDRIIRHIIQTQAERLRTSRHQTA